MISSRDLRDCLQSLSQLNDISMPYSVRQRIKEVVCVLNNELDVVSTIEAAGRPPAFNADNLLKDNIQLSQENSILLRDNMTLRDLLESKVQLLSSKIADINNNVIKINHSIANIT